MLINESAAYKIIKQIIERSDGEVNKRYLKRKKTNIQQIEVGLYKNYEIKAKYGAPEIDLSKVKRIVIVF
ncbi:predicted protein [Listeria monocytogenes FSL N1-017]|nr:predicted protein [Listeria monocytogenes FSL N1-017]